MDPHERNKNAHSRERERTPCTPRSWLSRDMVVLDSPDQSLGRAWLSCCRTRHARVRRIRLSPVSILVYYFPYRR
uniref:Epoxide hydrolase 2 n=1 Tax=Rhizophora mucronata TaxID=61149 RepID=A0A2P2JPH2_RHIMU